MSTTTRSATITGVSATRPAVIDRTVRRIAIGATVFLGLEGLALIVVAAIMLTGGPAIFPIILGASGILLLATLPLTFRSVRSAMKRFRTRSTR